MTYTTHSLIRLFEHLNYHQVPRGVKTRKSPTELTHFNTEREGMAAAVPCGAQLISCVLFNF